jgi:hypothetical protein
MACTCEQKGEPGVLVFHALGPPTHAQVTEVAARTAARIENLLRARGRSLEPDGVGNSSDTELGFRPQGALALAPGRPAAFCESVATHCWT